MVAHGFAERRFHPSDDLFGLTRASASDCWAVGRYSNSNGLFRTLIEHWDGTSWTVANAPNTNEAEHNLLFNVTCVSLRLQSPGL